MVETNRAGQIPLLMMSTANSWKVIATVGLLGSLSAFTNLKISGLQPEDLALIALLSMLAAKFLCGGFAFRTAASISHLARGYAALLFALLCLALLASRLPVFPLVDVSLLKSPLLFSASRFLQFVAVVCGFLWLTNTLIEDPNRLAQALNVYWRTGIVSCVYGALSILLLGVVHINILGAYDDNGPMRERGFFNEGGPFGIYLVSVLIIGLLRRRLTGRRLGYVNVAFWAVSFLFSQSRAAFFLITLLFLLFIMAATSLRTRVAYLLLATAVVAMVATLLNVPAVMAGYLYSYQNIESTIATMNGVDTNLVLGRVAGAYIVPRMVAAHPLTGIGIGNYSLMRNDPRYLGNLPDVRWVEDLPGLGLVGDAAELGVPATLFLAFLLLTPYRMCKQKDSVLGIAAIFQLLAHLMGVHLNFFYPWFVSACAIAAEKHYGQMPEARRPLTMLLRRAFIQRPLMPEK